MTETFTREELETSARKYLKWVHDCNASYSEARKYEAYFRDLGVFLAILDDVQKGQEKKQQENDKEL